MYGPPSHWQSNTKLHLIAVKLQVHRIPMRWSLLALNAAMRELELRSFIWSMINKAYKVLPSVCKEWRCSSRTKGVDGQISGTENAQKIRGFSYRQGVHKWGSLHSTKASVNKTKAAGCCPPNPHTSWSSRASGFRVASLDGLPLLLPIKQCSTCKPFSRLPMVPRCLSNSYHNVVHHTMKEKAAFTFPLNEVNNQYSIMNENSWYEG